MKWFKRKEHKYEYVPAPEPRELTGIEKMEIEWRIAEREAEVRRDAKLRLIIAAKRASIQPQLDEIQRLEQELSPRAWLFQNAYGQQQNIGMGSYGPLGSLMGAIGGGKA